MRRSNKHQISKINFMGLTGGINVAVPPEQIAENEMQECDNFVYKIDSQRLVGRGGLSAELFVALQYDIGSMHYDVGTNTVFIFCKGGRAYVWDWSNQQEGLPVYIGMLTGTANPVCAKFKDKLWIASGGKLQFYGFDGAYMTTVMDSPTCDICFQRNARLFVTQTGTDIAYYSGIGDNGMWEEDTNDASSSQWVEVGYGDDGDICAVVPMATDLFILKTQGTWYQFQSDSVDPQSWVIQPVATGIDAIGKMCATNTGNEVVYMSRRGLRSLAATMDYGNVATGDIGDKFQSLITQGLVDSVQMINLRRHKTIMIRPTSDKGYWVAFNYALGSATTIHFGMAVESIVELTDRVFVASGRFVYEWSDEYYTDNGTPIEYTMKPRDIIGSDDILVKNIDTKFSSQWDGTATVSIGERLHVQMPVDRRRKVHCNHSDDVISLTVESSVPFEIDHIILDTVEL